MRDASPSQNGAAASDGDSEGTPVGILEAGCSGTPVISTRHAGTVVAERIADFDQHTIGVHIRRTDNRKSIAHSPDQAFISQMRLELEMRATNTLLSRHGFS